MAGIRDNLSYPTWWFRSVTPALQKINTGRSQVLYLPRLHRKSKASWQNLVRPFENRNQQKNAGEAVLWSIIHVGSLCHRQKEQGTLPSSYAEIVQPKTQNRCLKLLTQTAQKCTYCTKSICSFSVYIHIHNILLVSQVL